MLKILEERRYKLQRRLNRLKEYEKTDGFYDWKRAEKHKNEQWEIENRLKLYSDYELIQSADESSIESRLNEVIDELEERQNEESENCEACTKENYNRTDFDFQDECLRCTGWNDLFSLGDTEAEALDVLELLTAAQKSETEIIQ